MRSQSHRAVQTWALLVAWVLLYACEGASQSSVGKPPITIDMAVDLSGPQAASAAPAINAYKWLVSQVNAKGGPSGHQIVLNLIDTGETAASGVAAVDKMINDKPLAIVNMGLSTQVQAVAPAVAKAHVLLLSTAANQLILYDSLKNPWIFAFHGVNSDVTKNIVRFIKEKVGATKVGMLVDDTAYGKAFLSAMQPLMVPNGMSLVVTEQIDLRDNDASSQVTKLLNAKPDIIIMQLYDPEGALVLREFHKRGGTLPPLFFTTGTIYGAVNGSVSWADITGTLMNVDNPGFAMSNPGPIWKAFLEKVKTDKAQANDATAQGYDGFLMLIAAIDKSGSTDPQTVQEELMKMKGFSGWNGIKTVASTNYACDDRHECWHGGSIVKVNGPFDLTVVATFP